MEKKEEKKEGTKQKKGGRKKEWNELRKKYGEVYGMNKEENDGKGRWE
jgi:hypothetical protein